MEIWAWIRFRVYPSEAKEDHLVFSENGDKNENELLWKDEIWTNLGQQLSLQTPCGDRWSSLRSFWFSSSVLLPFD